VSEGKQDTSNPSLFLFLTMTGFVECNTQQRPCKIPVYYSIGYGNWYAILTT